MFGADVSRGKRRAEHDEGGNIKARVFREACQACCITVMDSPSLSARSAEVWTGALSLPRSSQETCGKVNT